MGVLDYKVHHGASTVVKNKRDLCDINEPSLVLPAVVFNIKLLSMSFRILRNTKGAVTAVEVKFSSQPPPRGSGDLVPATPCPRERRPGSSHPLPEGASFVASMIITEFPNNGETRWRYYRDRIGYHSITI